MSLFQSGRLQRLICGGFYNDESRPQLTPKQLSIEILSGLTVSLALVPEAVAFAFVAGVAPLIGLYAAFIVGLITALFGGRPGMISGATGALAVVMVALVMTHGVQYLFATIILMGILQLIAGALRWGKFIRMVPYPVMIGFVNGLAIVIGLAQLEQFKITGPDGTMRWMDGEMLFATLGMIALTMLVIWQAPRVTKLIPAPLAAIGIVTAVVIGFGIEMPRVGKAGDMAISLPVGTRFSVWPFGEQHFRHSTGLLWPLDDLQMAPGRLVGTSNRVSAPDITIEAGAGDGYAVIMPAACYALVLPTFVSAITPSNLA